MYRGGEPITIPKQYCLMLLFIVNGMHKEFFFLLLFNFLRCELNARLRLTNFPSTILFPDTFAGAVAADFIFAANFTVFTAVLDDSTASATAAATTLTVGLGTTNATPSCSVCFSRRCR